MNYNDIDKENLLLTSLFELRNIARKYGVKSPTIYNKKDLVDKIMLRVEEFNISNIGKISADNDIEINNTEQTAINEKKTDNAVDRSGENINTDDNISKNKSDNNLEHKREENPKNKERKNITNKTDKKPLNIEECYYTDTQPEKPKVKILRDNQATYTLGEELDTVNTEKRAGYLEIFGTNGSIDYGFLRVDGYENSPNDAYIHANRIRRYGLRKGDYVEALVSKTKVQENKPAPVVTILKVNGKDIGEILNRPNFDDLVPIFPNERLKLETSDSDKDLAIRCIDIIAPIGKGQRAMIVSPPKAGKTTLLKKIANSISKNYPGIDLEVLLIDERPEEVTDMQRTIKGTVWYSTFDEVPEHHIKVMDFLLDKCKRKVEMGEDVVILMDSLTRLARANNLVITPTGRTLSGGIDPASLYLPKRFFGSARNIENGGSLTIIATALVDTGSRMDDVIFEEFKGTGNMEIRLDRKLSEKRIFPAIDLNASSTRRDDLLLSKDELQATWTMRKLLSGDDIQEATENLLNTMSQTKNNEQFIQLLSMQAQQIEKIEKKGYNKV